MEAGKSFPQDLQKKATDKSKHSECETQKFNARRKRNVKINVSCKVDLKQIIRFEYTVQYNLLKGNQFI